MKEVKNGYERKCVEFLMSFDILKIKKIQLTALLCINIL